MIKFAPMVYELNMPRDNDEIINLLHNTEKQDRQLLKDLIDAGAAAHTLGMAVERIRLSSEAINYLSEERCETRFGVRAMQIRSTPISSEEAMRDSGLQSFLGQIEKMQAEDMEKSTEQRAT